MAKTKVQKKDMLAAYKQKLQNSTGVILVSQTGLKPGEVNEFKKKLSDLDSTYNVVKNTIFTLALKDTEMPELETLKEGPHSAVFVTSDIAGTAKLLKEFMATYKDQVSLRGGILDGQALTIEQIQGLADMPSKEQSISMIAGLLNQSLAGVANVLQDSVQSVAIILDQAFKDKA